jgi:hypothetical protein
MQRRYWMRNAAMASGRAWYAPNGLVEPMSALPPKADIVQHGGNVRFVPILLQKSVEDYRAQ